MVELNHNVANINADGLIKGSHGVIVAVKVMKAGSSGAKIVLKNGKIPMQQQNLLYMERMFKI